MDGIFLKLCINEAVSNEMRIVILYIYLTFYSFSKCPPASQCTFPSIQQEKKLMISEKIKTDLNLKKQILNLRSLTYATAFRIF